MLIGVKNMNFLENVRLKNYGLVLLNPALVGIGRWRRPRRIFLPNLEPETPAP